jgi:hypothetical protein
MEINQMPGKDKVKTTTRNKNTAFYTRVLSEAEKLDFELAEGVEGIDGEIALLRIKIKTIVENEPNNIQEIMRATNSLSKLVTTRYKITKEQRNGLKEAITNVLTEVAVPLGVAFLQKKG